MKLLGGLSRSSGADFKLLTSWSPKPIQPGAAARATFDLPKLVSRWAKRPSHKVHDPGESVNSSARSSS